MLNKPTAIIGLGQAGCNIAEEFLKLGYKKVFKIDTDIKSDSTNFPIKRQETPEAWEENPPNLSRLVKRLKKNEEVLFIVCGSGHIANVSLVILEQLRKCKINVLYIHNPLTGLKAAYELELQEKVIRNVFEQYARSGVFERLYLIDNNLVDDFIYKIGGGATIFKVFEKLNDVIVSTTNMIFELEQLEPAYETKHIIPDPARLSTFGIVKEKSENQLFSLDLVSDIVYYYALNEEKLKTDKTLLKKIKEEMSERMKKSDARISFKIYATDYEHDYTYCVYHTSVTSDDLRHPLIRVGRSKDVL